VWNRGLMALTIVALVGLILATPSLLGRPTTELTSWPLLIVGMSANDSTFIINLGAAVQAYRYDEIRLTTNGSEPAANQAYDWFDTYEEHTWIPSNATFSLHAYFVDQQGNYFEYNLTGHAEKNSDNRTVMVFTFPYEADNRNTVITVTAPNDLRWSIPRRGTLP